MTGNEYQNLAMRTSLNTLRDGRDAQNSRGM